MILEVKHWGGQPPSQLVATALEVWWRGERAIEVATTNACCRRSTTMVSAASCTFISTQQTCPTTCTDIFSCRSSNARPRRRLSAATCRWSAAGRTATWPGRGRRRRQPAHTTHRHDYTALPRNCTDWRRNSTASAAPLSCLDGEVEQVDWTLLFSTCW